MAAGGKDREIREARERARLYEARRLFHAGRVSRSRRDNLIGGVVGGLIVLAAVGSQVAYFAAGPGAPVPAPSSTSTPAPTEATPPPGDPAAPTPSVTP